jgi:mannosyltransferase
MQDPRIRLELDDILYSLQRFGGASEYWREVTSRVVAGARFEVRRRRGSRYARAIPVLTSARLFHSSHFRVGVGRSVRNIATVHDLIYELGMAGTGLGARFNTQERRRCYFAADALICVSGSTRDDLLKVYPALAAKRIAVIAHGLPQDLLAYAQAGASAAARAPHAPYLLYVGGRQTYKNFDIALAGFRLSDAYRDGVVLRCTGKPFSAAEADLIRRMNLTDAVHACGNLARRDLFALYANAHGLLYTSSYEGFGLPVIEAMALGCPVIACKVSSIPEVAGDAAVLVPPGDPQAVASAIAQLGSAQRQLCIDRGRHHAQSFSWDRCAAMHQDIYMEMASR